MSNLILYAIPAFIALMALEIVWAKKRMGHREGAIVADSIVGYELKDSAASLTMGLGSLVIGVGAAFLRVPFFAWLYEHRFVDLGSAGAGSWLLLLFAEDLCYYWFHRLHHEVRVLWAAHVAHHSSQHYNLSTALRQPWATPFTGPLFWAPLPLLGFSPAMVLIAQSWSLLYQFWLHTEAVGKLGPLEWVLNTPSHHRVHHGTNPEYLDKNHGGIFILWDRLFGTFAVEGRRVTYGLTTNISSFSPLHIATHELRAMGRDLAACTSLRDVLRAVLGRPGQFRRD
jgi:sterol desaturase/sphingolipid hydroxylase (fatty acid hydroxylase superfamily)